MKICWKCIHPQAISRYICFFIRTDLEKFMVTSLLHQQILCSEWVPSEWQSKQLINMLQYFTSTLHNSRWSINVLWSEKPGVCNEQILQDVFNFKPLYIWQPQYCIAFSSEKVVSSDKYTPICFLQTCSFSLHKMIIERLKSYFWIIVNFLLIISNILPVLQVWYGYGFY